MLAEGALIPRNLDWLAVGPDDRISSAHRVPITARIAADALSDLASVLRQNGVTDLRIGQTVKNAGGIAWPT